MDIFHYITLKKSGNKGEKKGGNKFLKTIKLWTTNPKHKTKAILFYSACILPLTLIEGIKLGIFKMFMPKATGFEVIAEGLTRSFFSVLKMRDETFISPAENLHFDASFLVILLLIQGIITVLSFIAADRNKNRSDKKDGNMEFQDHDEFNKIFAFPQGEEGYKDAEEDSYEPGNMIISENIRYSLEPKGTNTYSCALVVGATGCGKTFTYVKPNILQMNSSYVITDPKGELCRDTGNALLNHGYDVKVFNTAEPQFSCHYNPFKYIRDEQGVATMVSCFLDNTQDPNSAGGNDPFFGLAEKNFYLALFYYVFSVYKDQPEKQTLKTIYELYQMADEPEGAPTKKGEPVPENKFDQMFRELAEKDPSNPAIGYYATFKKGSPKTKQSILISVGVRMWFMSIPGIANLLSDDNLHLETMGDKKSALFAIIKAEDGTFNFLSAMLFTQLFETLYYVGNTLNEKSWLLTKGSCIALRSEPFIAGTPSETETKNALEKKRALYMSAHIESDNPNDKKFCTADENGIVPWPKTRIVSEDGIVLEEFNSRRQAEIVMDVVKNGEIKKGSKKLISHVRFMLDEFANIGKIPDFEKKLATFRSLRISSDIIVQSITQLQEMYEDHEGKITSNCSIKILLGANDMTDCKWFSDIMGQTTVRSQTLNIDSKGLMAGAGGGSMSDNAELLMRPEEIHAMPKDQSIILINTMMPIKDKKFSSLKHKRWKETFVEDNPEQEKNEFQYRRLFYIKQRKEAQVVTYLPKQNPVATLGGMSSQNAASNYKQKSNMPKNGSDFVFQDDGETKIVTGHPTKTEQLMRQFETYKKNREKQLVDQYKKEKTNNPLNNNPFEKVPFIDLPESSKQRLAKGINSGKLKIDKTDETIIFEKPSVADAMSSLIDM